MEEDPEFQRARKKFGEGAYERREEAWRQHMERRARAASTRFYLYMKKNFRFLVNNRFGSARKSSEIPAGGRCR